MDCILCKKEILDYSKDFNRLVIDEKNSVDICEDCSKKIISWHGKKFSRMFPTRYMKKKFQK